MVQTAQETLTEQLGISLSNLEKIAQTYFKLGHLEQALQLFQVGRQLLHIPEVTQRDQARFLLGYGNMLAARTQFLNASVEEALMILEQARQLATEIEDEQITADVLDGLGFAHYVAASNRRQGNPQIFQAYFQESLERRRALHDERGTSETLFHLGLTSDVFDQREAAHDFYTQALQIAREHSYAEEASESLRHLGFHEQAQGNFSQAQQYFEESLHLREEMGMQVLLPFALVALAHVCLDQGNTQLAEVQCQRALALSRQMDIKRGLIFSLFFSGRVCEEKREYEQAREYYQEAFEAARAIDLKHSMQESSSALQRLLG